MSDVITQLREVARFFRVAATASTVVLDAAKCREIAAVAQAAAARLEGRND